MSQLDVLKAMMEAKVPMTTREIAAIVRPNEGPGRVRTTRMDIYNLEKNGKVRRAGSVPPARYSRTPQILWEVIQ